MKLVMLVECIQSTHARCARFSLLSSCHYPD
nr:MAG TPA_asm: hypothetical protein [Caudoviricetes sp.]